MRLSIDEIDYRHSTWVRVYCDSRLIKNPISANEEQGIVEHHVTDDMGCLVTDSKGELVRQVMHGTVLIHVHPYAPSEIKEWFAQLRKTS